MSIFVEKVFREELCKLEEFKAKDYEAALKAAFRRIDVMLLTEEGKTKLKEINASCG